MGGEFGGVHALDSSDAVGEISFVGDAQWVFEDIGALAEIIEKEIGGGVFGGLVISEIVLPAVTGNYVFRFHGGGTHVFHMNILHGTIHTEFDTDLDAVADL